MFLTILLKYWREITIAILAIIVAFSVNTCQKKESDIALLNQIQDSTFNELRVYKDKAGKLATQVNTYAVTVDQLKENGDKLGLNNKSLKQQIGSLNNLVSFYRAKISLADTFTVVNHDTTFIIKGDTTHAKAFHWSNKYLVINGFTAPAYTTISYDYHPSFELKSYWKDKGFLRLKKGQLVTDITFNDPNIQVREFRGIVIQQEPKKWYETRAASFAAGIIIGRFAPRK